MLKRRGRIIWILLSGLSLILPVASWSQTSTTKQPEAQARRAATTAQPPLTGSDGEIDIRTRINNWSISILGGYNTGVLIRMAVDLQTAFEDGDNLRILPIVSHGAKQNILDLLYLRGADIAISHADVFEELKKDTTIRNLEKRIRYISQLHVSGIYILVRPEIKTLKDLEGKKVGFHGVGSGVDATASIIFPRLGINVQKVNVPNPVGLEQVKTGELSGLVHLLTRRDPFIAKIPQESGLHLLSVEYNDKFTDYYTPYTIGADEYPNLLSAGQNVETLGLPAVLAVYNWPKESDRYRRVERFIEYYFSRFDKLKQAPYQPDWKSVNINAKVPGWLRYDAAEEALAKLARNELAPDIGNATGATLSVDTIAPNQRQLFNEFLEWKKQQASNPLARR
jgi:TRAP-type uncharacterized transport system substrate-binding protein